MRAPLWLGAFESNSIIVYGRARYIMKIAAVIAEYNPFHNGHAYQLRKIKEDGIDCIIVVMSGNFVQRGMPSVYNMHDRTRMALENGADLVIELPVQYSTGSAEYFAKGAIGILEGLGCIDYLYFGSELGIIEPLRYCSEIFLNEPDEYKSELNTNLKAGLSFPKARALALKAYIDSHCTETNDYLKTADIDRFCGSPNNILGIEYIKELIRINSQICPRTIKREGSGYNDDDINEGIFASASGIRQLLQNECLTGNEDFSESLNQKRLVFESQLPESVYEFIIGPKGRFFITQDDFSSMLYYQLMTAIENKSLREFYDVNSQLSDIFTKNIDRFESWTQFVLLCKSREYTYSRLNRCMVHVLLQIGNEEIEDAKNDTKAYYARVLGFTDNGKNVLGMIKKTSVIPVVTKLADASNHLSEKANKILLKDIFVSNLYNGVCSQKYRLNYVNEYRKPLIVTGTK